MKGNQQDLAKRQERVREKWSWKRMATHNVDCLWMWKRTTQSYSVKETVSKCVIACVERHHMKFHGE